MGPIGSTTLKPKGPAPIGASVRAPVAASTVYGQTVKAYVPFAVGASIVAAYCTSPAAFGVGVVCVTGRSVETPLRLIVTPVGATTAGSVVGAQNAKTSGVL